MRFDARDGLNSNWLAKLREIKKAKSEKERKAIIAAAEKERWTVLSPAQQKAGLKNSLLNKKED